MGCAGSKCKDCAGKVGFFLTCVVVGNGEVAIVLSCASSETCLCVCGRVEGFGR